MELLNIELYNNFTELDSKDLQIIEGGNFAEKVGLGLVFVGSVALTIAFPPVGIAAKVVAGSTIGGSFIGLIS